MSGLDPSRIALVVAKPADGGAPDQPKEQVATGYFLTGDLVLTAGHVADHPGCKFRIRAEVGGSGGDRWSDATPAWKGGSDVDAMLLRTTKWLGHWEAPRPAATVDGAQWTSHGFARAAADEDERNRKTLPLNGSVGLSLGQGVPELVLQTNQNIAPDWESYWKGISGAPVFSNDSGGDGLIGIITGANKALLNGLIGLPVMRLLDDIHFQSAIAPPFLGVLPSTPWCLVLTPESSRSDLVGQVGDVLARFRAEERHFQELHQNPIAVPVLKAVGSVGNWAATVDAMAHADYVIADVTAFEPAVMLLLGVRSVLRRGVTVSVSGDDFASHTARVPFNVQETKVLSYHADDFDDDLHRAMAEGATNLARDSNYLDLPAYHAVRAPRPETWAEDDAKNLLVLCPFGPEYSAFYRTRLLPIVRAYTGNMTPLRMLDLKSPRLVGQALYEQIRWSSRCLVDWTGWSSNVFFELGVRLACSPHDPLCIIQRDPREGSGDAESRSGLLEQHTLLRRLLNPVEYDHAHPRLALKSALESWSSPAPPENYGLPSKDSLPPAATFEVAQASFLWQQDAWLTPPHIEEREGAERIFGKDQERRPERLILFADNEQFDAELRAAVMEKWIAAWLYLGHLSTARDTYSDDTHAQLITVGQLVVHMLSSSSDPRHINLREDIQEFLRAERDRRRDHRRTRRRDSSDG